MKITGKRTVSILLALVMILALLPMAAQAAENPYPMYNYYNSASDNQIACTWYAWQQAYDRLGVALPSTFGNAGDWYNNAASSGYSVGSSPRADSIACWSTTNSPPWGHVAYVTGVNSDGSFNIVEGGSGWPGANWQGICSRTVRQGQYWPDKGFIYLTSSSSVSVTFTPWEDSNYTYIRETDASVGMNVQVSGGVPSFVGMVLYNASGTELARGGDYDSWVGVWYFKINEELHYTLTPGTTYKYKFYAIVNGKEYWSDMRSFKTNGTLYPNAPSTPTVTVDGRKVTVLWSDVANETGYDIYLIQSPWRWEDIKYHASTSASSVSMTFGNVAPGEYKAFVISRPNSDSTQSPWTAFTVTDMGTISSITLAPTSITLKPGESAYLSALISPSGTGATITWSTSNSSVATISSGKVTAIAKGTATITAKAGDKSATCAVTVTEKATAPQIQTFEIAPATVEKEYFEMLSASGTAPITWTITSGALPSGMYLDEAGYISGMPAKAGNYSFTVSAKNSVGSATATFTLKVNEKPVQGVEVHFARITIYFQGQFIDVPADQWYTGNVAAAYEFGLMRGTSGNTFTPYGDVTIAEAITMASRIHSLYTTGAEHFDQSIGNAWYQTYLDYAYSNGIISYAYYNCDVTHKASRAQFAEIFANSLPDEALAVISSVADGAIPDVSMGASYAPHVYKLYRAGILTGSDANGTFNPQTYITRSEAAAIVSRMAESNNRVRITLG